MSNLTEPLVADHRFCDELFAQAEDAAHRRDWETCRRQFDLFNRAMTHHFQIEEEVLFPRLEQVSNMGSGPTGVMRGEHENMRELMHKMLDAMTCNNRDDYLGLSETLLLYLQQHNLKEENMLYATANRLLSTEDVDLSSLFNRRK